jgi:hypothetical protein
VVRVSLTVNDRPDRWGYGLLRLPHDSGSRGAVGFPVCSAITRFAAQGYGSYLGWVQLVRGGADPPDDRDFFILDLPPMFGDLGLPFATFGPAPELFDAPSMSDRHGRFDWVASTFLCSSPTCVMTPVVEAVLGFSWGYEIRDGEISPKGLRELTAADWESQEPFLRQRCPGWTFLPGFRNERGV